MDVVIGRFQPFHKGHKHLIDHADTSNLLILVGSAFRARSTKNPFTFEERRDMLLKHYPEAVVEPIPDSMYNEGEWLLHVREVVNDVLPVGEKVCLIGHKKDDTSYYLDNFPDWDYLEVEEYCRITDFTETRVDATRIREIMLNERTGNFDLSGICGYDPRVHMSPETFQVLKEEFKVIEAYKESWASAPFPPTFNCSDAVVLQSGHVLLIRRKHAPGKGLWALPGGFIDQNETAEDAALRELREETCLKVPEDVLRGSIFAQWVFDHPYRSTRGRTFSHAFGIKLKDHLKLPRVKGGDDADKAQWFPISDLPELYEDHEDIINYFNVRQPRKL